MFERLKRTLGITPAAKPAEPQTRVVSGGTVDNPFMRLGFTPPVDTLSLEQKRQKNVQIWRTIYRKGGPVATAIDAYPKKALTNGWNLVCEEGRDDLKDLVQAWLDQEHVDLGDFMRQAVLDACVCGTAIQEIIPTRGAGNKKPAAWGPGDIWGVVPRDASSFRIQYDAYGRIVGYTQTVYDKMSPKEIPVDQGCILSLTLWPMPGEVYGISLIERAYDDIMRDCDVVESITKAIHRHGTPKQQWQCGDNDHPASTTDLDTVKKEIQTIDKLTDFATTHLVKINPLDVAGVQNIEAYSNVTLARLAAALGVPREMLGLTEGGLGSGGPTVRMQDFYDTISSIQEAVARTYSRKLLDRLTGVPGAVWIEFNDVSPEDEKKKAEVVELLRRGLDPDAVIDADEAREWVGLSKRKEENE